MNQQRQSHAFFFNKIMTEIYGRKKRKCILECLVNQNAWLTKMFGLNSLPQVENCIKNISHDFCKQGQKQSGSVTASWFWWASMAQLLLILICLKGQKSLLIDPVSSRFLTLSGTSYQLALEAVIYFFLIRKWKSMYLQLYWSSCTRKQKASWTLKRLLTSFLLFQPKHIGCQES